MTDTTENSIDLPTVYALLNWQENGGLLGHPDLDIFLELLSEARHDDGGTTRSLDSGSHDDGGLGSGRFVLIVETHPASSGLPQKTTVRTSKGDLSFDGAITMACFGPSWFVSNGKLTLEQVLQLSAAVKHEEELLDHFYDDIESQTESKTIDAAIVAQLLEWQENGGLLEQTAFDTFLELLSEARHNDGGTNRLESSFGLDEAGDFVAGLTDGVFVFYLDKNPDSAGLPQKTTVRTSKGDLSFDGQVQMLLSPALWSGPDDDEDGDDDMTPEQMRRFSEMVSDLAAAVENEENEKRSGGAEGA
jgi:hypothetical protein